MITEAALIAEISDRSHPASDGCLVFKSTLISGLPSVLIGFIAPRTMTGLPLVIPPSNPPALLLPRTNPSDWLVFHGRIEPDFIMNFGAGPAGGFESQAELDALERLYARDRRGDPAVQSAVPGHAASQPDRAAENVRLDDSAGGILGHFLVVDELPHRFVRGRIGAIDLRSIPRFQQFAPILFGDLKFSLGRPNRADKPESLDPKLPEQTRASAPAATRAAVSRALARSSVSRQSVVSHLTDPAKSA